ncbi:MAG: YdcF family protein, partial [Candidatus Atribacteria bacterium]|nr:YdcF family protein [Candidatus Atribacteria bacterium]
TFENATFTMDMIRKQDFKEVILVTSAIHMPRAMFAFQNSDIPVIPYPVNFLYENISPGLLNIFPNRSSWEHNLRALHEWVGLLYYKLII